MYYITTLSQEGGLHLAVEMQAKDCQHLLEMVEKFDETAAQFPYPGLSSFALPWWRKAYLVSADRYDPGFRRKVVSEEDVEATLHVSRGYFWWSFEWYGVFGDVAYSQPISIETFQEEVNDVPRGRP